MWLFLRVMSPNDADGMANWVCTVCPSMSVQKLKIIMVISLKSNEQESFIFLSQICVHRTVTEHTPINILFHIHSEPSIEAREGVVG